MLRTTHETKTLTKSHNKTLTIGSIAFIIITVSLMPNTRSYAAQALILQLQEQPELFVQYLRAAFKSLR